MPAKSPSLINKLFWSAIYIFGFGYFAQKILVVFLLEMHLITYAPQLADMDFFARYTLPEPTAIVRNTNGKRPKHLNILFVGSNYTIANDLPAMFMNVAVSDPKNSYELTVGALVRSGARLRDLWNTENREKILAANRWDVIVLQEFSLWAIYNRGIEFTKEGAYDWNMSAEAISAKLVFFQTWPRQPGSGWYGNGNSTADMHKQIDDRLSELSRTYHGVIVPVCDTWMRAAHTLPSSTIYESGGSTPSVAGTYLSALVFYRDLLGDSSHDVTYMPAKVALQTAKTLKNVVAGVNEGL